MRRRALIHIGLEKTGSTALQNCLAANRQRLLAGGVLMPSSIGYPNHTALVAACLDDGVVDNIKQYYLFATGCSEGQLRRLIFNRLDRDIGSVGSRWHSLLITSELISSRLSSRTEIRRLLDLIHRYVDHVQFVVFLRRQDRLALSRFSSILRSGYTEFGPVFQDYSSRNFICVPDQRTISDSIFFYDFEQILERFDGLPATSLDVYAYDTAEPIQVFSALLEMPLSTDGLTSTHCNRGMSAHAQYVFAQMNRCFQVQFPSGLRNDPYRRLQRRIEQELKGDARVVERKAAIRFFDQYVGINKRVACRDPGLQSLCLPDFSDYPDFVDYSSLPALLSDQLTAYRALANTIPLAEARRQMLAHRFRRMGAYLNGRISTLFT